MFACVSGGLVAVAVLATVAMMVGLGLATAGLANSPEHAQVTTLAWVVAVAMAARLFRWEPRR